jgi:hypothetical protein
LASYRAAARTNAFVGLRVAATLNRRLSPFVPPEGFQESFQPAFAGSIGPETPANASLGRLGKFLENVANGNALVE